MMDKDTAKPQERRTARPGDIVTIDLNLVAENGFVPEPLFDGTGRISFVVGWGNYLPGLHELVSGMAVGDRVGSVASSDSENSSNDQQESSLSFSSINAKSHPDETTAPVSLDAGWGARRPELVVRVPKEQLQFHPDSTSKTTTTATTTESLIDIIEPGVTTFTLQGGSTVLVTEVAEDSVVLDANPPLAGSSYACACHVLEIESLPPLLPTAAPTNNNTTDKRTDDGTARTEPSSPFAVATFALGCFWGAELAFMRLPGVVGTKAGYTQGQTAHPTYEQVCTGRTKHREAVLVVYDTRVVSYQTLVQTALWRFREGGGLPSSSNNNENEDDDKLLSGEDSVRSVLDVGDLFREPDDDDADENIQYQHGVYYHSLEQLEIAQQVLSTTKDASTFELLEAGVFYDAEEYHQQYLYKGGQSAKKGCKTKIRCYG